MDRLDRSQPEILVGTTQGVIGGPMKIQLNPGWRFSKRTYQGKVLGHVYFSYSDEQAAIDAPGIVSSDGNSVYNNNLEPLTEGTVQDVVAPATEESQEMIMDDTPMGEDSEEIMMETPIEEDSQGMIIENIPTDEEQNSPEIVIENTQVTENNSAKKNRRPLTMNRFQSLDRF